MKAPSLSLLVLDVYHPLVSRNYYSLCIIDRLQRLDGDPRAREGFLYMPRVELRRPPSLQAELGASVRQKSTIRFLVGIILDVMGLDEMK